ncbi:MULTISPECIES: hypothetical protein [Streptomyces]|uniref:hypothetical protein n=1 Tax=Streptomyces TaxID=1883 RepID=UPI002253D796|nr:hypothetical protein [Streptomyces virginiae]MCX4721185.1 hypothetical protein [Streptomyces virginiae]MCX5275697.1 hypothetical protein [Streptomyces virginiae]WTB26126.1 hypothetical protein OG253_34195 [Streptomyces virginiae]
MRSAFYTLAAELAATEDTMSSGVYAVCLNSSEVEGKDPQAVAQHIGRLVRRAGERPTAVVRKLPSDVPTELEAAPDEWLAVVNEHGSGSTGWVVVARTDSVVVRLGPGRLVLSGQAGSPLVHVPPSCADLLPPPPVPQWGGVPSERTPHV